MTNDIVKNKHVLGGLTLRDLTSQFEGFDVKIEGLFYMANSVTKDALELWDTTERCYDNEPADRTIDLDTPVKVKDGNVILIDVITEIEETMVFGKTEFVQTKIEIL
jgi:hypothetical protein